jgi:hypothetical protein
MCNHVIVCADPRAFTPNGSPWGSALVLFGLEAAVAPTLGCALRRNLDSYFLGEGHRDYPIWQRR